MSRVVKKIRIAELWLKERKRVHSSNHYVDRVTTEHNIRVTERLTGTQTDRPYEKTEGNNGRVSNK